MVEIYKEQLNDLLIDRAINPDFINKKELKIKQNSIKGTFIEGVTQAAVESEH